MAVLDQFQAVQKIYIAYYQRPADPAGLKYWAERVEEAGGDTQSVMDAFANSAEATALYGPINDGTIASVIDGIYQALFGRAPDAAGMQFYIEAFENGALTAGNIALTILNSAQNADVAAINNKLEVADEFTSQVDGRELSDSAFGTGSFAFAYAGNESADAARTLLAAVTSDKATVLDGEAVKKALEAQVKPGEPTDPVVPPGDTTPDQPETFRLTEALALEELPEVYNLSDATVDFGALAIADVAAKQNAAQAIVDGASNADKLTLEATYTIEDTLQNVADANLADDIAYALTDAKVDLGALAVADVAAAQEAAQEAAQAIIDGASNADELTFEATYTIADTLENLEAAGADVRTGAAAYSLTNANSNLGPLIAAQAAIVQAASNAADYTFGAIYELTAARNTLVGTAGDDAFNAVGAATLQTIDNLDGGAGDDTLNIAAGGLANGAAPIIKNIETINNADVGNIAGYDAAAGVLTITKALDLAHVTGVEAIWSDFTGVTNAGVHYKNASLDTVFGVSNAGPTQDASYVVIDATGITEANNTAKIALTENLVGSQAMIVFGNTDKVNSGIQHVQIDVAESSNADVMFISSDAIQTLTITGAGNVNIGDVNSSSGSPTSLVSFDASAATGKVSWTSGALTAESVEVLGGSGADYFNFSAVTSDVSLTIDGGAGNDIIVGGAGDDTIIAGEGVNTLTGGAGADTFVLDVQGTTRGKLDSITDFNLSEDILVFGDAAMSFGKEGNTLVLGKQALSYADLLLDAQEAAREGASFVVGKDSTDAYAFYFDSGDDGADAAVKLVGVTSFNELFG